MVALDNRGFIVNHLLSVKGPCRVATTAAITLSGQQTIDGVAVVADDRVLVKDQSDNLNGIYICKTGEWELADDFDQRGHVVKGTRVFITDGTTNGQTEWYVTTSGRPWPGREAITFAQLFGEAAASSVSFTPTGGLAATNVQDALAELDSEKAAAADLTAHLADTSDAHDASAVSVSPAGSLAATDAQAALVEILGDIEAHVADSTAAHAASAISFTPTGTIAATDVQAAIAEVASEAGGGSSVDRQVFDSSDTWDKPSSGTVALIQCWGAGGSGGRGGANDGGGGGGGGAYVERLMALSDLGATETVTIGAGGATVTVDNTNGNAGGNTTFGAHVTGYGGGGGNGSATTGGGGGGGGGQDGAGTTATDNNGGSGGTPRPTLFGTDSGAATITLVFGAGGLGGATGGPGNANIVGGAGGSGGSASSSTPLTPSASVYGGGGGGGGDESASGGGLGGSSTWGGAGGGGGASAASGGAGGTSLFGGAGGAGATDANNATAGTQPGGGGGGSESGNSGAGAAGRVIVTVW